MRNVRSTRTGARTSTSTLGRIVARAFGSAFAPALPGPSALALPGAVAVVSLLALSACTAQGGPSGTASSRTEVELRGDTTIVRTVGFERRMLELVEELSIGVFEGDERYMFGSIGSVAARPDGSVLVFDAQYAEIRHYGPDGAFIRTIGRQGEGPGEFSWISGLRALPDGGFAMWDAGSVRLTRWGPAGSVEWSRLLPLNITGGAQDLLLPGTGDALGVVASFGSRTPGSSSLDFREGHLLITDARSPLDTIISPELPDPAFTEAITVAGRGGRTFRTPLVERPVFEGYGARGMLTSPGAPYVVDRTSPDGAVLRIEVDAEPVPALLEEREWFRENERRGVRRWDPGWDWSGPPIPEVKPFIRTLRADEEGWIWVQVHQIAAKVDHPQLPIPPGITGFPNGMPPQYAGPTVTWEEPVVWDIFTPDGEYHGSLEVLETIRIAVRGHDVIWGVTRDEFDVETLRRYRLREPPG